MIVDNKKNRELKAASDKALESIVQNTKKVVLLLETLIENMKKKEN